MVAFWGSTTLISMGAHDTTSSKKCVANWRGVSIISLTTGVQGRLLPGAKSVQKSGSQWRMWMYAMFSRLCIATTALSHTVSSKRAPRGPMLSRHTSMRRVQWTSAFRLVMPCSASTPIASCTRIWEMLTPVGKQNRVEVPASGTGRVVIVFPLQYDP